MSSVWLFETMAVTHSAFSHMVWVTTRTMRVHCTTLSLEVNIYLFIQSGVTLTGGNKQCFLIFFRGWIIGVFWLSGYLLMVLYRHCVSIFACESWSYIYLWVEGARSGKSCTGRSRLFNLALLFSIRWYQGHQFWVGGPTLGVQKRDSPSVRETGSST